MKPFFFFQAHAKLMAQGIKNSSLPCPLPLPWPAVKGTNELMDGMQYTVHSNFQLMQRK